jgi:hypothetical protein
MRIILIFGSASLLILKSRGYPDSYPGSRGFYFLNKPTAYGSPHYTCIAVIAFYFFAFIQH